MRFPCLASSALLCALTAPACVAPRPTPSILSAKPIPGYSLLVLVAPLRGIPAGIVMDDDERSRTNLAAGGSLYFQLKPGRHRLRIMLGGIHPVESDIGFSMAEGETKFVTLDPSGLGTSVPGPVSVTLMEVSRDKAARIARY